MSLLLQVYLVTQHTPFPQAGCFPKAGLSQTANSSAFHYTVLLQVGHMWAVLHLWAQTCSPSVQSHCSQHSFAPLHTPTVTFSLTTKCFSSLPTLGNPVRTMAKTTVPGDFVAPFWVRMVLQWQVVPAVASFPADGRHISQLCFPGAQVPALLRGVVGVRDVQ